MCVCVMKWFVCCLCVFTRVEAQLSGAFGTSYGDQNFVATWEELQTSCSAFPGKSAPPLG